MDTRSGDLYTDHEVSKMPESERKFMKEVNVLPTKEQWKSRKLGRNELCLCGSGKKFKKCCLVKAR